MTAVTPVAILRGLALGVLVIAWAWLAHDGSAAEGPSDFGAALATSPIVAIAIILLWRVGNPLWLVLGGLAVIASLAWLWPSLRENVALLYFIQHLGTNLALATLFGRSLFGKQPSLVTQFALLAHNGIISEAKARYTRQVTIAWTIFFLMNAGISILLFLLAPASAWSIFANLLQIPLLILMFGVEHLCRHRVLPPADRSSIGDTIRGYRASSRRPEKPAAKHP